MAGQGTPALRRPPRTRRSGGRGAPVPPRARAAAGGSSRPSQQRRAGRRSVVAWQSSAHFFQIGFRLEARRAIGESGGPEARSSRGGGAPRERAGVGPRPPPNNADGTFLIARATAVLLRRQNLHSPRRRRRRLALEDGDAEQGTQHAENRVDEQRDQQRAEDE